MTVYDEQTDNDRVVLDVVQVPARSYLVRDCWAAGTVVGTVPKTEDLDSSYNQNNVFSHAGTL